MPSDEVDPGLGDAFSAATRFLLDHAGPDGLWRDFLTPAGEASSWPSGFIGAALPRTAATAAVLRRAANALVAAQNPDGGWGYNEEVPTDADSTVWVSSFLQRLGTFPDACRRAADRLGEHRRGGGVATYARAEPIRRYMGLGRLVPFWGWCMPHTEVTAVAGRTWARDGRTEWACTAWQFVKSQQRSDGSWASYWWTSPHYATVRAAELAAVFGDHAAMGRARDWVLRSQSRAGSWGTPERPESAFATALSLSLLLAADDHGAHTRRGLRRLLELQNSDGSWPSHALMRIPLPPDRRLGGDQRWRPIRFATGMCVEDQHRTFTTAACVTALGQAGSRRRWSD